MGALGTLVRLVREGKTRELAAHLGRSFFPAWLFRKNEMVVVRLQEPRPLPRPLAGCLVRWGTPADEPLMQAIRPRRKGYARNFAQGHLSLVAEVEGQPAAFGWFETGEAHPSRTNGYTFRLGPGVAWAFGIEVAPRFRLSGAFHKYFVDGSALLREKGFHTICGSIQADNPHSINSHRRMGFQVIYKFKMLRVLGITWHRADPVDDPSLPQSRGLGRWKN